MITNHEFIADEKVISKNQDIKIYQETILQEILKQQNLALIHQFNFNNTKKRFIMMTKKNSKLAKTKKFMAIPAFALLAIVFAEKSYAKENSENLIVKKDNIISKVFSDDPYEEVQKILSKYDDLLKNKKYAEFDRKLTREDRQQLINLYSELTDSQKEELPFVLHTPGKLKPNAPTENDLIEFSNSTKYGLWIDEKKVFDIAYGEEAHLTPAEYPGGANKLRNLVMANFDDAVFTGDEGTVKTTITFIVDENGKVRDIKAVGDNEKFNSEANRAVKLANNNSIWKAATLEGKPVAFQYKIPLAMTFEIYKKTQ